MARSPHTPYDHTIRIRPDPISESQEHKNTLKRTTHSGDVITDEQKQTGSDVDAIILP